MVKKSLSIFFLLMSVVSAAVAQVGDSRATSSVLSKGRWAKVKVEHSGMYTLTADALKQMGFDDISKISVYGNGGSQLPFSNSANRIDDLAKQPVVRTQGGLVFYAEGTDTWTYNTVYSRFIGQKNAYSESSYYFITDSQSPSEAPQVYAPVGQVTNSTSVYTTRVHHEENDYNILSSGRDWYGNRLTPSKNTLQLKLPLPSRSDASQNLKITVRLVGSFSEVTSYEMTLNGEQLTTGSVSAAPGGNLDHAKVVSRNLSMRSDDTGNCEIGIKVNFVSASDLAWIDYVSVTSESALDMKGESELDFRYIATYSRSGATNYTLSNVPSGVRVWQIGDLSNIREVSLTPDGKNASFVYDNGKQTEFIAFDPNASYPAPEFVGVVANQNLHATEAANYVIITHGDFLEEAERLAKIHRENQSLKVVVADCEKIYNEFSSGKRDVAAIRDFIKMVYDRGTEDVRLENVLLFGDGSFDNLHDDASHTGNKVPTYQSSNSVSFSQSYVTDDFFGWLDDNEGSSDTGGRMDVGVGRFPCQTKAEAKVLVDKSEIYLTALEPGSWKRRIAFVADDGDSNEHLLTAHNLSLTAEASDPDFVVKRIYLESYMSTTYATGLVYTGAHDDFMNAVNEGSLLINYAGHGATKALTGEGLFEDKHIDEWHNRDKMPLFVTAACDFGPFDKDEESSGVRSLLYEGGGFIGVYTTTRLVYSDSNFKINDAFLKRLLSRDERGDYYSIGEASRYAKVETGGLVNSLKYVLLGDPAISLATNHQRVVTDSVNGVAYGEYDSPIPALGLTAISGSVRDEDGEVDETFNGMVDVSLYDKKAITKTTGVRSSVYTYPEYKNVLYNGSAEVRNGHFNFQFVLSKDINFNVGYGRMYYYATSNDRREADGVDNGLLVGGIVADLEVDTIGPLITAWVDYIESSTDGYTSGGSPTLFAYLEDPSGINTGGLGIGHDISLVYDGNRSESVNLNSYFTYELGSYTRGLLVYQMSDIPEGQLNITLKAWDNRNNSSSKDIDINVKKGSEISFGHVKLYPNPMLNSGELTLEFSHNSGGAALSYDVSVYSLSGQVVASKSFASAASQMQIERLSLLDEMPVLAVLPNGIYVLKLVLTDSNGRKGEFTVRYAVAKK